MSQETMEWLNNYTLVGFTDKRGKAWHYRVEDQGDEDNHYPGAIPVEDVVRRLFNWKVIEAPVTYIVAGEQENAIATYEVNGNTYSIIMSQVGRKGMLREDTFYDLGAFKDSYQGHDYEEWLINNWGHILDTSRDELGIGSAGLLQNGARAWVSIERPETLITPEGIEFRPFLLAYSSFDGSLATNYAGRVTNTVCDNTLNAAIRERGQTFKLKHTRHSQLRILEAREALGIIFSLEDTFQKEIAELSSWKVSDAEFAKFLDLTIPVPEIPEGKERNRGTTVAEKKRDEITALYKNDERAAPWTGTALGVLQAFNTWNHHYAQVRGGVPRVIRNMENAISGKFASSDRDTLEALESVTS